MRSFCQGYLNIITPLYLLAHGVSATGLGAVFSASFVVGGLLTAPIGVLSDRIGRKPFLVAFTVLLGLWGLLYATSAAVPILLVVSAIAGIGRGGGGFGAGQAGPFAPAEQALLADLVPASQRRQIFSLNAILVALSAAVGAAAAGLPSALRALGLTAIGSETTLYVLTAVLAGASLLLLIRLQEPERVRRERGARVLKRQSARLVIMQSLAGSANAFGLGFINSLFVVWIHLRYHVGASAIGPLFTVSFLLSAASISIASATAGRIGSVKTIVVTRLLAVVFTIATALSPTFFIAALFQVLRSVASMMAAPVRQAFTMGLFTSDERASAAGLTGVARRLSGAASPPISGALFDVGSLEAPFYLAAGFQLVSAVIYSKFFSRIENPTATETVTEIDLALDETPE